MSLKKDSGEYQLPLAPWGFFHISNLLSYLLTLAGILAIRGAHSGLMWQAGAALAIASLLDLLDGIFARRFRRTEAQKLFGVQIDSLSDAFAFGVVPIVVAMLAQPGPMPFWWIACAAFYLLSALTRLGYYNLQTEERGGFTGVPTTLMGLMWSTLLAFRLTPLFGAVMLVCGGTAMIVPIRIARPKPLLFCSVIAVAVLLAGWHISNGFLSQPH